MDIYITHAKASVKCCLLDMNSVLVTTCIRLSSPTLHEDEEGVQGSPSFPKSYRHLMVAERGQVVLLSHW